MKIESEKLLERKLVKAIHDRGGWCIKLLPFLVAGLPDRICLLPGGVIFFAEIKTTGKRLRPAQEIAIKKLSDLRFVTHVVDKSQDIKDIMDCYAK